MTFRRRLEHLEGPKPSPADEAAMDAEIKRLVAEISARDGISADVLLAQLEAEVRAAPERP